MVWVAIAEVEVGRNEEKGLVRDEQLFWLCEPDVGAVEYVAG